MDLNDLLEFLSENTHFNINIHDVSGIFSSNVFDLDGIYRIHPMPFCNTAKTTPEGYTMCTRCKSVVCKAAMRRKKEFFGMCPYGLFELVYPVMISGKTLCIIFIGNTTECIDITAEKAHTACRKNGVPYAGIAKHFADIIPANRKRMVQTAQIISDFIKTKYTEERDNLSFNRCSSVVSGIIQHIDAHYNTPLELGKLAAMYFVNEKYAGRLFLRQTGSTFHQYLTRRRLEAAVLWLENSEKSITEIALECGFGTASYLNRLFRRKYGVTPSEYRKKFKS